MKITVIGDILIVPSEKQPKEGVSNNISFNFTESRCILEKGDTIHLIDGELLYVQSIDESGLAKKAHCVNAMVADRISLKSIRTSDVLSCFKLATQI